MIAVRWQFLLVVIIAMLALSGIAEAAEKYEYVTKWGSEGTGDGQFHDVADIAVGADGTLYVDDSLNHRIQTFTPSGGFLGSFGALGAGDGQLNNPKGVEVPGGAVVYVTEVYNDRVQMLEKDGTYVGKWGSEGTGDGQFNDPVGVAVDAAGNVYVVDRYNHRVQKFTSSGAFVTKWGGFGSGDGQFRAPHYIVVDGSGDVYVTDSGNHRVQKFTSSGAFVTKWGGFGFGDGQFDQPTGIAIDATGNVYVADYFNNRVQKFSSAGVFVTKWGTEGTGDGQFRRPFGVAVDGAGNVYVTDFYNVRVQKFAQRLVPVPGRIAFASGRDWNNENSNNEIYVMNSDGAGLVRLTNNPTDDEHPAWSPDGAKIAFQARRDDNYEVYVMDADGTGQTRLTDNPAPDELATWSPDGTKIAFASKRDGYYTPEIYVMNADGTGQTRVTINGVWDSEPAWSPDGSKIAFSSDRDGDLEIHVMNPDGTGQTRITDNGNADTDPAWSPDGSKIAFVSDRDGTSDIYVMNADGTGQARLTTNEREDIEPAWSPDGMQIAYTSYVEYDYRDVYVMNADGTSTTLLIDDPARDFTPAWRAPRAPDASFEATVSSGKAPLAVLFTDTSSGSPTSWSWDFGDTYTSTDKNPAHIYTSPGTYTVTLTVSNSDGSDTASVPNCIRVIAPTPPVAAFSANVTEGVVPFAVGFTDESAYAATWAWEFGDGGTSSDQNPVHVYAVPGVFQVNLTVTNDDGVNRREVPECITARPPPPTVAFTQNTSSGTAPLSVQFTDTSAGAPTSWQWSFGDGSVNSTEQSPVHTYTAVGVYTVALTATNPQGSNTTTLVGAVTVLKSASQPVAGFTWAAPAVAGVPVQFTDTSTGTISGWSWDFGEKGTSTLQHPVHSYAAPGIYEVALKVKGPQGWSQVLRQSVAVQAPDIPLLAGFNAVPVLGNVPLTVYFKDLTVGAPTSWQWSFGDGTTSNLQNPTHTYRTIGKYTVQLTVTDASGQVSNAVKKNYINAFLRRGG